LSRSGSRKSDHGLNLNAAVLCAFRVLLNASLYKGMTIREQAGKPQLVMMVLPVLPPEDGQASSPESVRQLLCMFRLPSAERGQEFKDICTSNVPA
jgi:hypothetical protein